MAAEERGFADFCMWARGHVDERSAVPTGRLAGARQKTPGEGRGLHHDPPGGIILPPRRVWHDGGLLPALPRLPVCTSPLA